MSVPEVLLWQRLNSSPEGVAFRRQHPIGPYRVDFYCAAARPVVEVDGMAHDMGHRPERDGRRQAALEAAGYDVMRIAAAEVLRDASEVAASVVAYAASPLRQSPAAAATSPSRGGFP